MNQAGGLRSRSELFQRVVSALVLAAVAVATAFVGSWTFAFVWTVLALAVIREWEQIVAPEIAPATILAAAAVVLVAAIAFYVHRAGNTLFGISGLAGAAGLAFVAVRSRHNWAQAIWLCTGMVYGLLLLTGILLVRGHGLFGFVAVFFLFIVVWLTDIAAYFGGRYFGGPKFAPAISPKKTWSGVVCGITGGVGSALLLLVIAGQYVSIPIRPAHWIIALILSISAVYGDLFESFLKRRFGVKDAGSLIPGHGGFLDRLDGFTAATVLAASIGLVRGGWSDVAGGLLRW